MSEKPVPKATGKDILKPARKKTFPLSKSNSKIDITKALELRIVHSMSYGDIGKFFGVSKGAAYSALQRFNDLMLKPGELQAYREQKPALLESVEAKLLDAVANPEKIEKASLNNAAYALGQISNMTRLEKGLSTSNVAYMDMADSLSEIQEQRKQLEAELEALNG